jgi:hypothetical protein
MRPGFTDFEAVANSLAEFGSRLVKRAWILVRMTTTGSESVTCKWKAADYAVWKVVDYAVWKAADCAVRTHKDGEEGASSDDEAVADAWSEQLREIARSFWVA